MTWLVEALVPRANLLADITAECPGSDLGPDPHRDLSPILNGQEGDTPVGVNGPVWSDALGWAGFNAALAGSAAVSKKGRIGRQVKIEQDFSQ